ncbi:DegT/DnrJ/EryC1/StrS family aminotransferase [[Eubacterium] hominis]|uniref:DegT/DnrJ/EryC1/StrS family aminotransferase n=1 Tax=[Eubacterium] hominis TaxID=2764325 RepID=UPI003A4DE987
MEFINLKAQYSSLKDEIDKNIHHVLDNNRYMMGSFVKKLEKELAEYVGVKYCISCANGTDALQLALMVWGVGKGDAVFVPDFTFFSTAEVVSILGATPIFIDIDKKTFNLDSNKLKEAINKVLNETDLKPKVIIPVDLFGQPANFEEIRKIAQEYNLHILEDGAQGFGGSIDGKMACSFGDISTTSFFPAKPLGCYGDGGAIFTDNDDYYQILQSLRIHGKGLFKYDNVRIGMNSRLDEIQAGILLPKLKAFEEYELDNRNKVASIYSERLEHLVKIPFVPKNYISSWAQYTILVRSEEERSYVQNRLNAKGIPTMIYYPKPLHNQTVYKNYSFNIESLINSKTVCKTCLSLPMHPYLTDVQQNEIISEFVNAIEEYRNE